MKDTNTYITDSFQLASYLLAEDFVLSSIDPISPHSNKLIFSFYSSDNLMNSLDDYHNFRSMANPHKFFNAQRTLKSIIVDNKKERKLRN